MNSLRYSKILILLSFVGTITGCSIKRMVTSTVSDLTDSLYQQRDVQVAREGSASFLLLIDGFINGNPDDPDLLLTGTQTYAAYASAFAMETDEDRAFILFDHALDLGMRMWRQRFGWHDIRQMDIDQWTSRLRLCNREDTPYLYWTANAWSGWITSHPESTLAVADLSYVVSTMDHILSTNPEYQDGAVHLFFGIYYAVQPRGMGRDLEKSRAHFEKAMQLAGPHAMLPKVLFARYYARAQFDEILFTTTLQEVLDSPSKSPKPELNLMNAIARERAAVYLQQLDDLF